MLAVGKDRIYSKTGIISKSCLILALYQKLPDIGQWRPEPKHSFDSVIDKRIFLKRYPINSNMEFGNS